MQPYQTHEKQAFSLPFVLLTNGGGILENARAKVVNKIAFGNEDSLISGEKMILCHTPLKDKIQEYQDKYVLFSGLGDTVSVFADYGFKKGIDIEELLAIHPEVNPLTHKWYPESKLDEKKR